MWNGNVLPLVQHGSPMGSGWPLDGDGSLSNGIGGGCAAMGISLPIVGTGNGYGSFATSAAGAINDIPVTFNVQTKVWMIMGHQNLTTTHTIDTDGWLHVGDQPLISPTHDWSGVPDPNPNPNQVVGYEWGIDKIYTRIFEAGEYLFDDNAANYLFEATELRIGQVRVYNAIDDNNAILAGRTNDYVYPQPLE
jgi:hypothetical protein